MRSHISGNERFAYLDTMRKQAAETQETTTQKHTISRRKRDGRQLGKRRAIRALFVLDDFNSVFVSFHEEDVQVLQREHAQSVRSAPDEGSRARRTDLVRFDHLVELLRREPGAHHLGHDFRDPLTRRHQDK